MSDREALFVRLPSRLASQLDAHIQSDGRTKQAVVTDLLATQLEAPTDHDDDEILDLKAVAALLRVSESDVLARVADGNFPARRFGEAWRCSRNAVIVWLAGTDPVTQRPTGFAPPR
jgi:predicted DNA-binding transcriptional regulator AlpA